jgi:hypothetical protein
VVLHWQGQQQTSKQVVGQVDGAYRLTLKQGVVGSWFSWQIKVKTQGASVHFVQEVW